MISPSWFALAAASSAPLSLRRLLLALPGDNVTFDFDTTWFERNINVLYPVLGVGTLALVGWAVWTMARSEELSSAAKTEYRRQIISMLRQFPVGIPAETIGARLKLSTMKAAQVLEDMREDNMVERDETRQPIIWRVKGIDG